MRVATELAAGMAVGVASTSTDDSKRGVSASGRGFSCAATKPGRRRAVATRKTIDERVRTVNAPLGIECGPPAQEPAGAVMAKRCFSPRM